MKELIELRGPGLDPFVTRLASTCHAVHLYGSRTHCKSVRQSPRVFEGVAKSQFAMQTVVFQVNCAHTSVFKKMHHLLLSGVERDPLFPEIRGRVASVAFEW